MTFRIPTFRGLLLSSLTLGLTACGGRGSEVPEGGSLVAFLKPTVWLAGLPLGQCVRDGDVAVANGTVRIDDKAGGACSNAENTVKENIKRSGDLRKSEAQ
jgi:hypothetical protein